MIKIENITLNQIDFPFLLVNLNYDLRYEDGLWLAENKELNQLLGAITLEGLYKEIIDDLKFLASLFEENNVAKFNETMRNVRKRFFEIVNTQRILMNNET